MSQAESTTETHTRTDFTVQQRPFGLGCPLCDETWTGTNLRKLAKRVAWHWNKNHNDELGHSKTQLDTVERGGHQTVGNNWSVERIPIYLTAFDVLEERLGQEDGWATVSNEESVCQGCLRETPEADRVITETESYKDEWRCSTCIEEEELERKRTHNRSLTDFEPTNQSD